MDNKKNKLFGLIFGLMICLIFPLLALADNGLIYNLQVPILGITQVDSRKVMDYIVALYKFATYVTIALAFLGLVYGGFVYMVSGGNSEMKQHGRDYMWGAVWGLLIIFGSWALLNTINPAFVKSSLGSLPTVNNEPQTPPKKPGPWVPTSTYKSVCKCVGGCAGYSKILNLPPEERFATTSPDHCTGPAPDCANECPIPEGESELNQTECCNYQKRQPQPTKPTK